MKMNQELFQTKVFKQLKSGKTKEVKGVPLTNVDKIQPKQCIGMADFFDKLFQTVDSAQWFDAKNDPQGYLTKGELVKFMALRSFNFKKFKQIMLQAKRK